MPRRAAAYLRVSSEKQADGERFGYDRQINDIRQYAERLDFEVVAEHRDAITGKSITRQGLDQLIAHAHEYDLVLISSVDRLARDVTSSYQVLANLLASKLTVHSADQGVIDLEQESSLIQFNLQSLFAHLERHKIVTRTRAARNAIARDGGIPNGLRRYGLTTVNREAVIVPDEAEMVREMYEASASGRTLRGIAADLTARGVPRRKGTSPWRFTDVAQIIKNPVYKGEYRWVEYVIPVPPIVTDDLWRRAQPRGRGRVQSTSPLLLIGHVRCGRCGQRVTTHSKRSGDGRKRWYSYRCLGQSVPRVSCDLPTITRRVLEPLAEREVRRVLSDEEEVRRILAASSEARPDQSGALERLEAEDDRWLEAFRAGAITAAELGEYRADVRKRRRALAQPAPQADHRVDEYARMARELPLPELLDLAGVEIIVHDRDSVDIHINAVEV